MNPDDYDSERDSYRPREPPIAPVIEEHEPRPEVVAGRIEEARASLRESQGDLQSADPIASQTVNDLQSPDDDLIDDIRNTLLESYDQTLDMNGPNWEHMARKVYELHIAPTESTTHDNQKEQR